MAIRTVPTPVGPFTFIAAGTAVVSAGFTEDVEDLLSRVHPDLRTPTDAALDPIAKAVDAYFDGALTAIDAITVTQLTSGAFLGHAWKVMRDIPAGVAVTYTEFAERAGNRSASRAAASACARNNAALFVPCHRVVRTDGGFGGYRWGIDVKQFLLAHEQQMTKMQS